MAVKGRLRRDDGFTLLELLVVLTILGLVALLIPTFAGGSGARLRTEAANLAVDLRDVRNEAVQENRVSELVLSSDASSYRFGQNGTARTLPGGMTVAFVPGGALLVGDAVPRVEFFPDGSSNGGTITLSKGKARASIIVAWLDGRVSVDE